MWISDIVKIIPVGEAVQNFTSVQHILSLPASNIRKAWPRFALLLPCGFFNYTTYSFPSLAEPFLESGLRTVPFSVPTSFAFVVEYTGMSAKYRAGHSRFYIRQRSPKMK